MSVHDCAFCECRGAKAPDKKLSKKLAKILARDNQNIKKDLKNYYKTT